MKTNRLIETGLLFFLMVVSLHAWPMDAKGGADGLRHRRGAGVTAQTEINRRAAGDQTQQTVNQDRRGNGASIADSFGDNSNEIFNPEIPLDLSPAALSQQLERAQRATAD